MTKDELNKLSTSRLEQLYCDYSMTACIKEQELDIMNKKIIMIREVINARERKVFNQKETGEGA